MDCRADIFLRDDDPQNLADVQQYVTQFINANTHEMEARLAEWGVSTDNFVAEITEKSKVKYGIVFCKTHAH